MQFLMGLNESYAQNRGQILMMEPLPSLSKVFSLIIQEERQRSIGYGLNPDTVIASAQNSVSVSSRNLSPSSSATAMATNFTDKARRDRPLCSHCGRQGHTVDKCYKLHGFPPGFKSKAKVVSTKAQVNQATSVINQTVGSSPGESSLSSLTNSQCQQLIALLNSQLQGNLRVSPELPQPGASVANFSGIIFSSLSFNSVISSNTWILDTGATHHVCCSLNSFDSVIPTFNSFVTLPNGNSVPVKNTGSIRLLPSLTLSNVLFVPDFFFNLISISALTKTHQISINFLSDSYVIQDLT